MRAHFPGIAVLLIVGVIPCAADAPPHLHKFLASHCLECHQGDAAEAGLDLTTLKSELDSSVFDQWVRVFDRVDAGEMPPPDFATVPAASLKQFRQQTREWLTDYQQTVYRDHGRVRGRRLTNLQLERTLQDLLGIDIPLTTLMPEEPRVNEFKTIAAGQSISHFHLQTHLDVVDTALAEAFRRATSSRDEWTKPLEAKDIVRRNPRRRCREPEMLDGNAVVWTSTMPFYGRLPVTTAREDGWYRIRIKASALNTPAKHGVWCTVRTGLCVSGAPLLSWVGAFEVTDEPQEWTFEAWLPRGHMFEIRPGDQTLRRASFRGGQVGAGEGEPQRVAGLATHSIQLQRIHKGSDNRAVRRRLFDDLQIESVGKGQHRLLSASPQQDAVRLMQRFAERAFRRPVAAEDLSPYIRIVTESLNDSSDLLAALRRGYRALLCSPRFLHFHETPGPLDDYALAARISYMLWNSMPDDRLMELAKDARLQDRKVVRREVSRLLADDRGRNFVKDIAEEWLDLSEIDFTEPDRKLYPGFDLIVQNAMLAETHSFLQHMLDRDLSISNLIDARFTFLNSRLARYYDIDGVDGTRVRRVSLQPDDHRGGLLTQGAILKVTANGTTTSPVLRGVWISERLLGVAIPPPPDSVPAIEPDIRGATSIRDMLEKHTTDTSCAACHQHIDPPGFALENFDPSGRWRDHYTALVKRRRARGLPVDVGAQLSDGRTFSSLAEFQKLILQDEAALAANVARRMMAWGTGASCGFADRADINQIVTQSSRADFGFKTILQNVVASQTFRTK